MVDPNGPGNTFRLQTANDVYNFAPTNYLQRPDTRYGMGAFAHYEITPMFEAYADLMFMEDTSTYQIAPGGVFVGSGPGPGGAYQINCDNPLMTVTQQTQLCGANAGTPFIQNVPVARRNVEGGGRQGEFRHTEYRYVVGLRGQLSENWSYDSFLQLGSTSLSQKQTAYFITSRINNALRANRNAAGEIVCQSVINGTDPACVPYNIFTTTGVTKAALDYLQAPAFSSGNITERVANVNVVGLFPDLKSPMASDGIGVSFGGEYRREHLDFSADFVQSSGQLNGAGGASPPVNGGYDVYELFGEARVPPRAGPALGQGHHPGARLPLLRLFERRGHPTPTRSPATGRSSTASACAAATTGRSAPRTWWSCSRRRTWCWTASSTPAPASSPAPRWSPAAPRCST